MSDSPYRFPTRREAIEVLVRDPIELSERSTDVRFDYDYEAIAELVIAEDSRGWYLAVDIDDFWRVVDEHAR